MNRFYSNEHLVIFQKPQILKNKKMKKAFNDFKRKEAYRRTSPSIVNMLLNGGYIWYNVIKSVEEVTPGKF